ncbi:MAG TPA: ABC transporter substrate-binding protein [Candidatus Binatia bacterium]|jgi:phospholipid transport system substrate-binding protein|nr:ABC transporter substrate-binding protein [Candidatus Binatia bacterium]
MRRPLLATLLVAGMLATIVAAADDPKAVVQRTSDQVIAVLKDGSLSSDTKRTKVEQVVLSSVDFPALSRLVLARNWSKFSPAQQQEFVQEFQRHLSATYGKRLDEYRNENLQIVGDRQESNGDWTVKSIIVRGGGNDVTVDYRLRQSDGQWKIIDFIIERVSLVANFRSQFQDIVANGGPERLLTLLREKTAKGEPLSAS